jgi:hypothetical protein
VFGETDPVAAGRTGAPGEARLRAEKALHAYAECGGDQLQERGYWLTDHWRGSIRVSLDELDYWLTQARLWIVDALYDPDPDGPDNHDGVDRQQLEEAHRGNTRLTRG